MTSTGLVERKALYQEDGSFNTELGMQGLQAAIWTGVLSQKTQGSIFNSDGVSMLGYQHTDSILNNTMTDFTSSSHQRLFEQVESTGSEITFRCPTCLVCKECKHREEYESVSLKKKVEQSINDSSVKINIEDSTTTARLPFIANPNRLANNKQKAIKVYNQQLRKLNHPANKKDKQDRH